MENESDIALIINHLKKEYDIAGYKRKNIRLDNFSILEKGYTFRINYCWTFSISGNPIYLLSIDNSYTLHIASPSLEKTPHFSNFKYLYGFFEFEFNFPDTLIRPWTTADKFTDLIKHFSIKLENKDNFNKHYVIESHDKENVTKLLSSSVVDAIEKSDQIFIEINDNKCLLRYDRTANYIDTYNLIVVAKLLKQ